MFISSYHDKRHDQILVWEKENNKRVIKRYKCPYYFYVPDKLGDFESITGEKLKKLEFKSKTDYQQACQEHLVKFESDISPLERVMMDVYSKKPVPTLSIGFVDIEVDYDPAIGFSSPLNPYAPINGLTLYISSIEQYFTLAVPPKHLKGKISDSDLSDIGDNYFLFESEGELLKTFLEMLPDVDVLSGWNSDFFDLPYIGKRIEMLFGEESLSKLGFEYGPSPYWSSQARFKGSTEEDLILILNSRAHLDYMRVFKKFNLEGRQSYSLASIADDELSIPKLTYDGSLYELYNGSYRPKLIDLDDNADELSTLQVDREILYREIEDGHKSDDIKQAYDELNLKCQRLSFINFIKYNRRDVEILVELDKKFKYIELANAMVHEATVNFGAIFGSVQLIDTAIINFAHNKLNKIVFDKQSKIKQEVEGALVMTPRVGFHRWIASCDINSLYPSTYRSLNLSPEKIIGQLRAPLTAHQESLVEEMKKSSKLNHHDISETVEGWMCENGWRTLNEAIKNPDDLRLNKKVSLQFEELSINEVVEMTAREMIELAKSKKFAVSAYGTVLDQGNGEGLLPAVLTYWFSGRKELQALKKKHATLASKIADKKDPEYIENIKLADYYDMLQGVRKVLLNSTYGATLNEYCRFFDPRLGASTTGSGRQITTHMINTIAIGLIGSNAPKLIKTTSISGTVSRFTGGQGGVNVFAAKGISNEYEYKGPDKLGPIYSDTDSCYFVLDELVKNGEDAVELADAIVNVINASFKGFMEEAFFCQPEFSDLIRANREIVANTGVFRAKKKYVMLVYDMEGTRIDPASSKALKTQGSDIKLSSTPEMIRTMLKDVTMMVLREEPRPKIDEYIFEFRKTLMSSDQDTNDINILDFASVNSIKTYDKYYTAWKASEKLGYGKVTIPANVRAAINHNEFVKKLGDKNNQLIANGQKCKVLWIKPNDYGFTNMAFSSETEKLPDWFKQNFEVDLELTEGKLIDHKLSLIFDPLGWQVPTTQTVTINKLLSFD